MPLFSRTAEFGAPFTKNETVCATTDLPGVPQGTKGKVKVINGIDWTRYWVFFDNGVELGQLDTDELVRPDHWQLWQDAKLAQQEAAERAAEAAASGATDEAGAQGTPAAGAVDANDPLAAIRAMVPPHLLERSAAARARLTGG